MTTLLNHPALGKLRGLKSPDCKTTQYRGIKYASIPGRWKDPVLLNSLKRVTGEEVFDATTHGPQCPQHPGGFAFDLSLIGDNLNLKLESEDHDEFECLNLVVTVPEGVTEKGNLPVMVFVHGGGFSIGASSWPQYDLARLVATSVEVGKPVIGVSINYRLGPFGWLASSELGVNGNYALKDQVCAFKWIQNHISHFGGNPNRITAFGESAGSICVAHLLFLSTPLFNRAILMSGDSSLRRARSMKWQNTHYQSNITLLGFSSYPPSSRHSILHSLPANELVNILPMFQHWSPTIDGKFLREDIDLGRLSDPNDQVGKPAWCEGILMGDCLHDGTVLKGRIMNDPNILSRLHSSLQTCLTPTETAQLLSTYNLPSPFPSRLPRTLNPTQQFTSLLNLSSDIRFYFPILKYKEGRGKRAFKRYHFHLLNPLPGGTKTNACHELDLYVLLQNLGILRENDRGLGREMVREFLAFVYGDADRKGEGDVLVFGERVGKAVQKIDGSTYDRVYRGGRGEMLKRFGWERVFRLGELLQGCRGEEEGLTSKL